MLAAGFVKHSETPVFVVTPGEWASMLVKHRCACGETDPDKFRYGSRTKCYVCSLDYHRKRRARGKR